MAREVTEIHVYWSTQDPANEGWAFEASDENGLIASGSCDGIDADDLDGAIDDACYQLDMAIHADQFARDAVTDGGYATWTK